MNPSNQAAARPTLVEGPIGAAGGNGAARGATIPTPAAPGPSIPHGGRLLNLEVPAQERPVWEERLRTAPRLSLSPALQSDLELLANGGYSPIRGFLGKADFLSVVERMRLADGTPWSIPIVLPVTQEEARGLDVGQLVGLADEEGRLLAALELQEVYVYDKAEYARNVFRTVSDDHPGVARLLSVGNLHLAGPIHLLRRPDTVKFPQYHLDPLTTRRAFDERGWKTVVAFQTRNPIHRAHEFIQKAALEIVDGLLVHPLVGETKGDDIPAETRMKCYEVLLSGYYRPERTMLSVFPATMRYAGPREAIFHALIRKNYGCTHFIVGRDHAGVGSFYGTYDAQRLFSEFAPGELGITPLPFENTFYCLTCDGMASLKSCPHPEEQRVNLSGTKVREMLKRGELPPKEFTRPEVAQVLIESMAETLRDGSGI